MDALVEKCFLDCDEKMIGQHAKENMSVDAMLELMEDRPLGERRLHVPEGSLGSGEQDVYAPEFVT